MSRRHFIAGLMSALGLLVVGGFFALGINFLRGPRIYTDNELGMSFQYPVHWYIDQYHTTPGEDVMIKRRDLEVAVSLSSNQSSDTKTASILKEEPISISGINAIKKTFSPVTFFEPPIPRSIKPRIPIFDPNVPGKVIGYEEKEIIINPGPPVRCKTTEPFEIVLSMGSEWRNYDNGLTELIESAYTIGGGICVDIPLAAKEQIEEEIEAILSTVMINQKVNPSEEVLLARSCANQPLMIGFYAQSKAMNRIYLENEGTLRAISSGEEFGANLYKLECVKWYDILDRIPPEISKKLPNLPLETAPVGWAKYTNKEFPITFAYPQEATHFVKVDGREIVTSFNNDGYEFISFRIREGRYTTLFSEINAIQHIVLQGQDTILVTAKEYDTRVYWVAFHEGDTLYKISMEATSEYPEILQRKETFLQFLNSLRFEFDSTVKNL